MSYRAVTLVLLLAGLVCLAAPRQAAADYLGGVSFSHPTPSYLPNGETLFINIDYKIDDPAGGYVYARPYTLDSPTPGYGASAGSFCTGTGTTTQFFFLFGGENIVTHVRIYVRDPDTDEIELEMFVPVRYVFAPHGIFNLQMNHNQYDRLPYGENLAIDFDYVADDPAGCRIYARPFTNGSMTPNYSAGGSADLPPSGSYSQHFSFSGDADVTDIRFQIVALDNTTLLYEFFVPFDIHWADVGIYDVDLDWLDGSSIHNDQNLISSFTFVHEQSGGMRVWMAGTTGGNITPGSSWEPSVLVPPGGVMMSRYSRVSFGEANVDGLQYWVKDIDDNLIMEFNVPVDYHWAPHAVQHPVFSPAAPAIMSNGEHLEMVFDYVTSHGDDVRIYARPAYDYVPMFGINSSGSAAYSPPSGSGNFWLSFLDDEHLASQIRFQMVNTDQSELLLEHFYDGFWAWGTSNYVTPVPEQVPTITTSLGPCFPNPFNPTTTIPVFVARDSHVRLAVYDMRGRLVRTLQDGIMAAGDHVFTLGGNGLASGAYICRLETPDGVQTQRMTLVK